MSKTKSKTEAAGVLLGDGTIRLKQPDAKGKLVEREFTLTPYEDLPRRVRLKVRNALAKAMPDASSVTGKPDIFDAGYEAGLVVLRAAGAIIDPDDESLPFEEAEALDAAIAAIGIKALGEMNAGGNPKNAGEQDQTISGASESA